MRSLAFAFALLTVAGLSGADESPFFHVEQSSKNGTLHVMGKNTARFGIVAYVVVAESDHKRAVWQGVYTAGDTLKAGMDATVGDLPATASREPVSVFVDYVRLADGTVWGAAGTDQAKEIDARFRR